MRVVFEQVARPPDSSFGVFRASGRSFGAPYHLHPELELTWITAGRGDLVVGDHFGRFAPGDLIVHGPNLPHAYRADPGRATPATLFVQFSPEIFGPDFWTLPECARLRGLLARSSRGLRLSAGPAQAVGSHLGKLHEARGALRLAGLLELLELAARDPRSTPLAGEGYAPPRDAAGMATTAKILRAVDRGWREDLRLEDVARALRLHPQSLSRFCRRRLACGFSDLLVRRRLGEVARRLLETEAGVAETAFACGFNNLSNFNRLFRRAYGASPREFRARMG